MSIRTLNTQELKARARRELVQFFYIALYFYLCLVVINLSEYLVLMSVETVTYDVGAALIKALILAKFIFIAHEFHYAERFNRLPLIYPTLYASVLFFLLLVTLSLLEEAVRGLVMGKPLNEALFEGPLHSLPIVLARCLFMFVVLLNYFALRGIAGHLGEGKLFALFFRRRADTPAGTPESHT